MENSEKKTHNFNSQGNWDSLTKMPEWKDRDAEKDFDGSKDKHEPSPLELLEKTEEVREDATIIKEIRLEFSEELAELGDKVMDAEAYEGWEDELAEYYEEMRAKSHLFRPELAAKLEVAATDIAFRERTTVRGEGKEKHLIPVEAYAGHFMKERVADLKNAIEAIDEEQRDEIISEISDFYLVCLEHSQFLNGDKMQELSPEEYESKRTEAHNKVIFALNSLNDRCRQFGVRPLTLRNFEDTFGENAKLHNREQLDRKKADRGMVELYYSIAFKDLAEKAVLPDLEDEFQTVKYFHELGED